MTSKLKLPTTAFERVAEAMQETLRLYDQAVRDKTVAENLDRFDVARDLMQVSDHLRIAKMFLIDALRKAETAHANGEL